MNLIVLNDHKNLTLKEVSFNTQNANLVNLINLAQFKIENENNTSLFYETIVYSLTIPLFIITATGRSFLNWFNLVFLLYIVCMHEKKHALISKGIY